jgi:hypothetical protein
LIQLGLIQLGLIQLGLIQPGLIQPELIQPWNDSTTELIAAINPTGGTLPLIGLRGNSR